LSFGILTLATPKDYRKAIGLALSLRVSNPGAPTAVACAPILRARLSPFFDHVIEEDPSLRGFVHKVHLDRYSPFDDTFFFDADVLVFRELKPIIEEWNDQPYNATGVNLNDGQSTFGLDRARVLAKIGKDLMVEIGGAGHAYFRKPDCNAVFELARAVTTDYRSYAGDIPYADEDVMGIVMTMRGLRPRERSGFLSRYMSAKPGTLSMDATNGHCEMIDPGTGRLIRPYMMHFAAREAPIAYVRQLRKLFRKFDADPAGLTRMAAGDLWELQINWRVKGLLNRLIMRTRQQAGPI
jgi:hypothetical protein